MIGSRRRLALLILAGASTLPGLSSAPLAATPALTFAKPIVIDDGHAGGEPSVYVTQKGPNPVYLYSSHAGLSHYWHSAGDSPDSSFAAPFRNQTYIWRCTAGPTCGSNAALWSIVDIAGTGINSTGQGFSDPDFAEGADGRLYHTEITPGVTIDASADGGASWTGNPFAVDNGDRPWIAAGAANRVYLSIDPTAFAPQPQYQAHEIFTSMDGGMTFPQHAPDVKSNADGSGIMGFGKVITDVANGNVYEPALVYSAGPPDQTGSSTQGPAVGVALGKSTDGGQTFTQHVAAMSNQFGFFDSLTQDQAGTLYLVWAESDHPVVPSNDIRAGNDTHPVAVRYSFSKDHGDTWSPARDITRPGVSVFWPWASAGSAGMLGLAWMQSDRLAKVDSETSAISIHAAQVAGADTTSPQISLAAATGAIHNGTVCQEGTFCEIQQQTDGTFKDRRLGDYLTSSLDRDGHLVIAYGETVSHATSAVSRPGLVVQNGGPSFYQRGAALIPSTLTSAVKAAGSAGNVPASPSLPNTSGTFSLLSWFTVGGLVLLGLLSPALAVTLRRRRRPQ